MTPPAKRPGVEETTPGKLPEGTPWLASPMDHSFTLQAIIGLEKSVAVSGEKLDRLSKYITDLGVKVEDNCEKVRSINTTLARWATGAAVVVAIVLVLWAIVQFIPWDRISIAPAAHPTQPAASSQTIPATVATPAPREQP
jgi:hypothetical protein